MDADQFATALGKAVAVRRSQLGLSQRDLGERLQLSERQIKRIEQASRLEYAAWLFRLSEALECNLSTLVREAEGNG